MTASYFDLVLWIGSLITLLVQLYVSYLITFKSTQHMKEYTYFLTLLIVGVCGFVNTV